MTLTTGQQNALLALAQVAARNRTQFAKPTGVKYGTLAALETLGLAKIQIHPSGASARLTIDGRIAASKLAA